MDERKPPGRSTVTRRAILDILRNSMRPLSAIEVHGILRAGGGRQSLSTVYRALDSFTETGLLIKGALEDVAHYQINSAKHTHFAVCTRCKSVVPLKGCPLKPAQVADDGFEVRGHSLEVFGICGRCRGSCNNGFVSPPRAEK